MSAETDGSLCCCLLTWSANFRGQCGDGSVFPEADSGEASARPSGYHVLGTSVSEGGDRAFRFAYRYAGRELWLPRSMRRTNNLPLIRNGSRQQAYPSGVQGTRLCSIGESVSCF